MGSVSNPALARQEPLKLDLPKGVAVVGCGGVGSWVAYFLAMAGVPELWLFDHDKVSEHNLNRLPLGPSAINEFKSVALRDLCSRHKDQSVMAMRGFRAEQAERMNLHESVEVIVAATDTWATRKEVAAFAKKFGLMYVEVAAEGEFGTVTGSPADWATEEETKPGYASVPVWVGPCVNAAAIACSHILHAMDVERTYRLGWDKDKRLFTFTERAD